MSRALGSRMRSLGYAFLPLALGACTFLGWDSQSDAWEEFRSRCIERIATQQPVLTAGLEKRDISAIAIELHSSQDPTDTYWAPKNGLWVLQTNSERTTCSIHAHGRGHKVVSSAQDWLRQKREIGAFEFNHYLGNQGVLRFPDGRDSYVKFDLARHNEFTVHASLQITPLKR